MADLHRRQQEVATRSVASEEDLYTVALEDGGFEFESLIITPELDEMGHKIIERARSTSVRTLSKASKKNLAVYCICLEGRHPEILEEMNLVGELDGMRENLKNLSVGSEKSLDEIVDYLKTSPNLGPYIFGLFVKNERSGVLGEPFSNGMLRANMVELAFHADSLVTSSFPVYRSGHYLKEFLHVLALSPRKAIIYSTNPDVASIINSISQDLKAQLVNLYTIAKASSVFHHSPDVTAFVEKHIGWAIGKDIPQQRAYVNAFIQQSLACMV